MSPECTVRWDAEEYARNSTAQLGWARELIEKLQLSGNESVLDIGCGDGRVSAELARKVPSGRVLGCDNSPDMIAKARAAFPPAGHPNLDFQLMDARALEFPERFDVAFSNAALHWVRDQRAVLRGVARILRPGGRLLFQMGGRGNGEEIFAAARLVMESVPWRGFFEGFTPPMAFYGPDEYAPWCIEAGLRVLRAELLPKDMVQQGKDGLAGWVRTTWMPFTDRVPAGRREEFIRETVDRYIETHPLNARGEVSVRMVRLEVEAESG